MFSFIVLITLFKLLTVSVNVVISSFVLLFCVFVLLLYCKGLGHVFILLLILFFMVFVAGIRDVEVVKKAFIGIVLE